MSPVSSVRFHVAAAAIALFAAGCGSSTNPVSPMALAGSNTSQKGGSSAAGKVDVCHWDGVVFNMINVSSNALQSHLAHGDGQPNGSAPNGGLFNASCQVLKKYTVTRGSGSGGVTGDLDLNLSYAKNSGGTGLAIVIDQHGAYASLPGARWVSWSTVMEGWNTYGAAHTGDDITYTTNFTLPAGAVNASISGTFFADNRASGFLNSTLLGAHAAGLDGGYGTPVSFSISSGFVTGANTLKFVVQDFGGISGLAFQVTITYYAL